MPRTKLSAQADARNDLVGLLRKEAYGKYGGITCTPRTSMCPATICARMKNADKLTIGELRELRASLGIPKEDLLEKLQNLI